MKRRPSPPLIQRHQSSRRPSLDRLSRSLRNASEFSSPFQIIQRKNRRVRQDQASSRKGLLIDESLSAPGALSSEEKAKVRDLLKAQLYITTDEDEDDAENLLDYAMVMINFGESVGHVIEELQFMGMEVCDKEASKRMGAALTKFILRMPEPEPIYALATDLPESTEENLVSHRHTRCHTILITPWCYRYQPLTPIME